ncbi:MAG: cytochrome b N-terminal domain-containing protein, partial [Burkholderiales bacterium]
MADFHIQSRPERFVHTLDRLFDRAFGRAGNPLRQLGALGFHLFWVVAATGTYIYVFYDTSVAGAWTSVQWLEREQGWVGVAMRGLHRYASDALVLVVLLHLVREWMLGRFRGFRWFTWISGVPLLWLIAAVGLVGYWLVWDQ